MTHLQPGDAAPDFSGQIETGKTISLADYQGEKLILFFYPKDDTPGCTAAACSLRDSYAELRDQGYRMLGVSPDPVKKHAKFVDKYKFPFHLLADPEHTVLKAYGVWGPKKFMGREYDGVNRSTFIIDGEGKVAHVFTKVKTKTHAAQILEAV